MEPSSKRMVTLWHRVRSVLRGVEAPTQASNDSGHPAEPERYTFTHQGETRGARTFGVDFLPELERIFETYAPDAPSVLEWGAGLSTQLLTDLASRRAGRVVSIENNAEYAASVLSQVRNPETLEMFAIDLEGPRLSQADVGHNYSTLPLSMGIAFDFVLIDGRRRLECAHSAFILSSPATVVLLHDYRRTRYQAVKALFDVVEDGAQFRVMRPNAALLSASADERRAVLAEYAAVPPAKALQSSSGASR